MNQEDRIREAKRWLKQAENNLLVAEQLLELKYYSWSCFISHQTAECAIKSVYEFRGENIEKIHSITMLIKGDEAERITGINELNEIVEYAQKLDKYYIPTRYVNSIPEGSPYEYFNQKDAEECLQSAKVIINSVKKLLNI